MLIIIAAVAAVAYVACLLLLVQIVVGRPAQASSHTLGYRAGYEAGYRDARKADLELIAEVHAEFP